MDKNSKIYVAGSETFVGKAILRQLEAEGFAGGVNTGDNEPDLADLSAVDDFFARHAPEYVFMVAGRSGGIEANRKYPADLMLNNLLVECNVIHSAYRHGVRKLLYLASSCCYPKHCPQPMRPESLLTGPLEETNESYALAKIAGIKLCQAYRLQYGADFIVAIPGNVFGPGEDLSLEDSHVIAGLMRKMHEARILDAPCVEVWGTGKPRREFIFVEDLAACVTFVMSKYEGLEPLNLGTGVDFAIGELAEMIKDVVGYRGELCYDATRPDGMPLKSLDSSKLFEMGWQPKTSFDNALRATYEFLKTSLELSDA